MKYFCKINKLHWLSIITISLTVAISSGGMYLLAQEGGIQRQMKTYNSNNQKFNISFDYPEDWNIRQISGGAFTPFAILISDVNLDIFHGDVLSGYPDKFVNIVFYRTDQTEEGYALNDLSSKRILNPQTENVTTRRGFIRKYEGNFKYGKYLSVYKRSGEYLVIVETYINDPGYEIEVKDIFSNIIRTIEISR